MVTVSPASEELVDEIAEVWRTAWHDGHRGHVPDELVAARDTAYFTERARELVAHTSVARDGDEVLGVLIVQGDELQQLMVSAEARGQGVGAALLEAAEAQVAAQGYSEIWLAVVGGNATARRFYEAHGWARTGERVYPSTTLQGPPVPVPVLTYTKRLRGS